jgi:glutathione synthase/RimK-type ligase-like ATP-grasp enzyme
MLKPYASAKLLYAEAERRGYTPVWETTTGLFSVDRGGRRRYVYYTETAKNTQLGSTFCKDKFLLRTYLEKEGFPSIPFLVTADKRQAAEFLVRHGAVIQKPVRGERAIGVRLITNPADIDYANLTESLFERYVPGYEWRCFVLGGTVVAQQRKTVESTPDHPWRKRIRNMGSGEWDAGLTATATDLAGRLGMGLVAVDFIAAAGKTYILEANGTPGLYSFHHPDEGEPIDLAGAVLDYLLSE